MAKRCLWPALVFASSCLAAGCGPAPKTVDGGSESGVVCSREPGLRDCGVSYQAGQRIDLLFVVDDGPGSGATQAKLARGIGAMVERLDQLGSRGDYRIAVTSSSQLNPACPGALANGGELEFESCLDRAEDFADEDFATACQSVCSATSEELGVGPQPWVERDKGVWNIAGEHSAADVLACWLPRGTRGCEFAASFESLARAAVDGGLFDLWGHPVIIVVDDGFDCSAAMGAEDIFDPEGARVFWPDPDAEIPTQALCWTAGVACEEIDGVTVCGPRDYGADGLVLEEDESDAAVLRPVAELFELLREVEAVGWESYLRPLSLFGIGGWAPDGSLRIELEGSSEDLAEFGVAAGCEAWESTGVACGEDADCGAEERCGAAQRCERREAMPPPVRLDALIEALGEGRHVGGARTHSLCAGDLSPALENIAAQLVESAHRPLCATECLLDTQPETLIVDARCEFEEYTEQGRLPVPECAKDELGHYLYDEARQDLVMPSGEAEICFAALGDVSGEATAASFDDVDADCVAHGSNVVFRFARRPGGSRDGRSITGTCVLEENNASVCPVQ